VTAKEFIKGPLVVQIKNIGTKFPYHAFALEAIAIEFLGKALAEKEPWDQQGNTKRDFTNGIRQLFPPKYHPFSTFLYEELRCGMLHFFGPKKHIVLVREKEMARKFHLTTLSKGKNRGKLILVFEELHKDFEYAAKKLIAKKIPKLKKDFLETRHR